MSLRIPTRTLRTPRRPAGAERLVVRPRGNSACALLRCGYRVAHGPGPGRGSRARPIVVHRPRWCANKFTNPGAHETLREMCAPARGRRAPRPERIIFYAEPPGAGNGAVRLWRTYHSLPPLSQIRSLIRIKVPGTHARRAGFHLRCRMPVAGAWRRKKKRSGAPQCRMARRRGPSKITIARRPQSARRLQS